MKNAIPPTCTPAETTSSSSLHFSYCSSGLFSQLSVQACWSKLVSSEVALEEDRASHLFPLLFSAKSSRKNFHLHNQSLNRERTKQENTFFAVVSCVNVLCVVSLSQNALLHSSSMSPSHCYFLRQPVISVNQPTTHLKFYHSIP